MTEPPGAAAGADAAVEAMFKKLLELQLIPAEAQKNLLLLPLAKKQQMIEMHASLLADGDASAKSRFDEADDGALLDAIAKADASPCAGDAPASGSGALATAAGKGSLTELLASLASRLSTAERRPKRGRAAAPKTCLNNTGRPRTGRG